MPSRPKNTIAKQLNSAQVAINNAMSEVEIFGILNGFGYDTHRLNEGKSLYETARQAVNTHAARFGAQQDSTAKLNEGFQTAVTAYQSLAKVCRAIWLKDKDKLVELGITGKMPVSIAAFLRAAYVLFDNAMVGGEAADQLSSYGYTNAKLATERAKIAALDSLNQAQEAAKGAAQDSSRAQDAALKALKEWMARFVKIARVALQGRRELLEKLGILARSGKTKAQRNAPAKAAATRKAKKG